MSTTTTIVALVAALTGFGILSAATHRLVYGKGFSPSKASSAARRCGNVAAVIVLALFGVCFLGGLVALAAGSTAGLILFPVAAALVLGVLPGCAIDWGWDTVHDATNDDYSS